MTWRQSNNQWSGGPKNAECKNPLENFSTRFLGIKTASSSFNIFHRTKLSTRSITHFCWCNWRIFWMKTPREGHQGGLVLARQCSSGSPGTCNPEETGQPGHPISWSPTLFSGYGPVGLPSVLWTKKQLKGPDFSSDAAVIVAAETWLDGQSSEFFLVTCKS